MQNLIVASALLTINRAIFQVLADFSILPFSDNSLIVSIAIRLIIRRDTCLTDEAPLYIHVMFRKNAMNKLSSLS